MTDTQYRRVVSFAVRMCRFAGGQTAKTRRRAEAELLDFAGRGRSFYDARARIRSWDHTDPHPHQQYGIGDLVCDLMSEYLWDRAPRWARERDGTPSYDRWEGTGWRVLLKCALRAGLDMAAEGSAGVAGFTVGDLRRMYPRGIPAWLTEPFEGGTAAIAAASDDDSVWL